VLRVLRVLLLLLLAPWLAGCADDRAPSYQTPSQTYRIYSEAVADDQPRQVWSCLSSGLQEMVYESDLQRWLQRWEQERPERDEARRRLQIQDEVLINDQLGYLHFDETTVNPGESPFFYFVHEANGWKITTHLDPTFRQALERAVEAGEFQLPLAP